MSNEKQHRVRPHARRLALAGVLLLGLAGSALTDVIQLKDGRRFEGVIKKESPTEVVFETRFGSMTFARSQISSLERGTTPAQEFQARFESCREADDFFRLGRWAEQQKLKGLARKAMKRVRKLEPQHDGASEWLGLVKYKGTWMEEGERDKRVAAERDLEMLKRGLVRHGQEWVTLAEKERLDAGLVYHEGRWLTADQLRAARGQALLDGAWVSATRADVVLHTRELLERLELDAEIVHDQSALVAGPFQADFLQQILDGLGRGRKWFEGLVPGAPVPGTGGEPLGQFLVFGRESDAYMASVDEATGMSDTLPDGWAEAVKRHHGFVFWHPRGVSSARCLGRPEDHLIGHSFHHLGHILCNRLAYDGRLLPPWFDEGFASLLEFRVHEINQVFCVGSTVTSSQSRGTSARKKQYTFDSKMFRRGGWEQTLRDALKRNDPSLRSFDLLARKQFGELELVDIASGMAILSWLEQHGDQALQRFLATLKKSAPDAPERVILKGVDRQGRYDQAFQSAVGMTWREADRAWRSWFMERDF